MASDPLFAFEYVTSAVSLLSGDRIVVHVVNDSGATEAAHAIIYQNTGTGAIVAADSGNATVTPTWTWGLGFTISSSGEYWLRIQVTSEFLIPKAAFERNEAGVFTPVVSYEPGDFAIYDLVPARRRVW